MTETEPIGRKQQTVLVVDDQKETADLYADFLAEEYTVLTAYSGTKAIELLDADIDVVLLDRRMPGCSGDEVLAEIRRMGTTCRVVLVTAIKPTEDIVELPFDDYLVKPVSRETVQETVERMCMRNTYDSKIQEFMALASKMATLESNLSIAEMEESEIYAELETKLTELLESGVDLDEPDDDMYAEFTSEKIRAMFG